MQTSSRALPARAQDLLHTSATWSANDMPDSFGTGGYGTVIPSAGTFEPIGPRRAFEGAVEQIAQRIRHGDLAEGDRLPSERQLAEAMRISRPTLREAVKVLQRAGVLEVHPGATGGIFVALGLRADRAAAPAVRRAPGRGRERARGAPPARAAGRPLRRAERPRGRLRAHAAHDRGAQAAAALRRSARPRGSLPPARHAVPPAHGRGDRQPDRRRADALAAARARDRARPGAAPTADPRVGGGDPHPHAGRAARRRSGRDRGRDGRAPGRHGTRLAAGNRAGVAPSWLDGPPPLGLLFYQWRCSRSPTGVPRSSRIATRPLDGPVFLSGVQALVRLLLDQRAADAPPGCAPGSWSPATRARRWAASTRSSPGSLVAEPSSTGRA